MAETSDKQIVEEMWTVARNEPISLSGVAAFGFIDRDRYRRRVGDVVLTFTLDRSAQSGYWSYELEIADAEGGELMEETVQYWLHAFFGSMSSRAARRGLPFSGEARYTYPY